MNVDFFDKHQKAELVSLFTSVFSDSEGEQEGRVIGELCSALADNIDNQEIFCIAANEDGVTIGAIFFTKLRYAEPIDVFMLAPVAVSTAHQRSGVGLALITHGLRELKNRTAAVAITYGDPAYYGKVGFQPISEDVMQAPLPLSMPEGWLAQSLTKEQVPVLRGRPTCVKAFDNPAYW